ncbi:MAG: hypothetical protein K2W96_25980 [Gemmataceae bacterium]|nr:hypothetical protein [Gemmataceae bacterium]
MLRTLEEWRSTPHPAQLIRRASVLALRKLRLFALHCVRRLSSLITRPAVRDALAVAERFADGDAMPDELHAGYLAVRDAVAQMPISGKWARAYRAALHATTPGITLEDAAATAQNAVECLGGEWTDPDEPAPFRRDPHDGAPVDDKPFQCAVLRDLFPWEEPKLAKTWLAGEAANVAHAIYCEGRWQDLPVLGDALEEAGCDDEAILAHLRGGEPHWKGCWPVDLVLIEAGVLANWPPS